ncbi:MAG: RNA-directed DNA polymerase [Alphaproteobacteria bacterium]|nr:RNA-directed DNA polymerase [Alphaproteobacteria bacterium]
MIKENIEIAIHNITKFGDTDIFPFPIENKIIFDKKEDVVALVENFDARDIKEVLASTPPINVHSVINSGYTGFRWGTQIDPIWNIYYLYLVLCLAESIEAKRPDKTKDIVFSYRYLPNSEGFLFDSNYGWGTFYKASKEKAKKHKYVLICDISNFYQRISHHKLENVLKYLGDNGDVVTRIMAFLSNFSNSYSYGLPIGGNASRILAELLLNSVDSLLLQNEFDFTRFVDDYHIFIDSKEEAYGKLIYLSKILISDYGLSLQKSKTRVMTSEEFLESMEGLPNDAKRMMDISIKFDPYSPTAEEDYEELKTNLQTVDILGLLNTELKKSLIHQSLVSRIVKAIKLLDTKSKIGAVASIIDNLETLYPVIPVIFITIKKLFEEFPNDFKERIVQVLIALYQKNSYILQTDNNLAYMIRILSEVNSEDTLRVLNSIYYNCKSPLVRKDVILTMAKFNNYSWISNQIKEFCSMDSWCRRAMIIASFSLGDEGKHWRQHNKQQFSEFENIVSDWVSTKKQENIHWSISL